MYRALSQFSEYKDNQDVVWAGHDGIACDPSTEEDRQKKPKFQASPSYLSGSWRKNKNQPAISPWGSFSNSKDENWTQPSRVMPHGEYVQWEVALCHTFPHCWSRGCKVQGWPWHRNVTPTNQVQGWLLQRSEQPQQVQLIYTENKGWQPYILLLKL